MRGDVVSSRGDAGQLASVAAEVVVRTASTTAACGVEFQLGVDHLVYAYSFRDELSTDCCTRTAPLANAGTQRDIESFGAPAGCEVAVEITPWTVIKKLFAN